MARVAAHGPDRTVVRAIKLCTADAALGERHTYEVVLAPTEVRRPTWFASYVDGDAGVVVTDFVEGAQGDVLAGCSEATAYDIGCSIASLHSTWWGDSSLDLPSPHDVWRRPLTGEHVDRFLADFGAELGDAELDVVRRLPERVDGLADALTGVPTTVVHADLHLDNVLVHDDGTATILDWGRPRRAPAAVDLTRCFVEIVDVHPDSTAGRRFLDRYLDELRRGGIDVAHDELRAAVQLCSEAFLPGVIRWAVANPPTPGSRLERAMRSGLRRTLATVLPV